MNAIRDKIKKLLAVAEGQANEHESARAMELASALMMRHGIDRASLGDKPAVGEGVTFPIDYKWHKIAAQAAGLLYGAVPFGTHDWSAFRFVGRSDNVDAAQDTLAFILLQVEALYKASLPRGMSKSERAEFRRSFKEACIRRVYERCHAIVQEQTTRDSDSTGSRALVVLEHRQQLKAEVDDYLKAAGAVSKKARALSLKVNEGYLRGRRAGDQVKLSKEIES